MFLYSLGLFDCWATHPFKQLSKESGRIFELFIGFLKNIFLAPWTVAEVSAKLNNSTKIWAYAIPSMTFFVMFIILHIAEVAVDGCWAIGNIFSCFPGFLIVSGSFHLGFTFPSVLTYQSLVLINLFVLIFCQIKWNDFSSTKMPFPQINLSPEETEHTTYS